MAKSKGVTGKAPDNRAGNQYLTGKQNKLLKKKDKQDVRLAKQAGKQLKQVEQNYATPIDFNALPQAPGAIDWNSAPQAVVGQDFEGWRNNQIDQTYNTYLNRHQKDFDREKEDFEQMAAGRGWVPGSQVYNSEKTRLEQSQADRKDAALTQAQAVAGTNAQQFFDVGQNARNSYMNEQGNMYNFGNQYRQDAYGNIMQQRNQPLMDYNAFNAAQSGMGQQNNAYGQSRSAQDSAQAAAMAQALATKAPAPVQFGGFSSPQEQAAFEDQRARGNQQWQWQNQPRQQTANPWSQFGGQLAGQVGGAWASSLFK